MGLDVQPASKNVAEQKGLEWSNILNIMYLCQISKLGGVLTIIY